MQTARTWPLWAKVLVGAFILYSGLLCSVSLMTFVQALRQHWALKADDFVLQSLMTLFLPAVLIGLRALANGLLFVGVTLDRALCSAPSAAAQAMAPQSAPSPASSSSAAQCSEPAFSSAICRVQP